jgi:gamma-glutamyltranspeptidase / glutathione hydrolase
VRSVVGPSAPVSSVRGVDAIVVTADQLATQAGMSAFEHGGNAVDAAVAANAAIAVTAPHMCGLGGDLFAIIHTGRSVVALNASGRAGAGSDADALLHEGHREMPFRHDIRSVTVPGCVDGLVKLHDRFGKLPLEVVLQPAIRLAEHGFPASPLLVGSLSIVDDEARAQLHELAGQALRPGAVVRRPGVGRTLRRIAAEGREAFYGGEFGTGLLALAGGHFVAADLGRNQADWVDPLVVDAFGVHLHTVGPNSQGYLFAAAARLVDGLDLPADPDDPEWAHLLVEASTVAGYDRPQVLHDTADGAALVGAIQARRDLIDRRRAGPRIVPGAAGDTTYLCTADSHGMAVSLIQSNASGFGSWIVEQRTGINLHNRGIGFALAPGHPARLSPGRRPPHTLAPAMATRPAGDLAAVLGTMGGDGQPQVLLQIATRIFFHHQSPAVTVDAGRWVLRGPGTGFDTWTAAGGPVVTVEGHAPHTWRTDLEARGHRVQVAPEYDSAFGHAHVIVAEPGGVFAGAADPRARVGAAAAI